MRQFVRWSSGGIPTIPLKCRAKSERDIPVEAARYLVATRGSHRQFKHPEKPGRVTVAGKPSDDLAPGTLSSILKQVRLK